MSSQNQNRFLYPFYLKILFGPINRTQELLQLGTGEQAWRSAKLLIIHVREKTEREQLDKFVKEVERAIELRRCNTTYTQADKLGRMMEIDTTLRQKATELYDMTMKVFEEKGYLKALDTLPTGREIEY